MFLIFLIYEIAVEYANEVTLAGLAPCVGLSADQPSRLLPCNLVRTT